ncbi:MAG: B12-binding domain-containing radical SAM protein, partial [Candidatus Nanoarchaeia archaeon]
MKPKSLFVCPTSEGINALPLPPLGMLWVASYLRENGYSVDALDTYVDSDKQLLAEKIKNSDLVCISGTSSHQFESAKHIARVAKDLGKKTVFGGIHATVLPDDSSQHFDLVVRGEGEETMLDIVKSFPHILTDIPGTSYLDGSSVHHNSSRPLIRNIDSLPLPARDLIPPTRYPHRELKRFPGRYTSILGGRGCSDKCIFCGSPKMWDRPRLRSAESLF